MKSIALSSIIIISLATSASAATFFTEDFSGADFGSNLSQTGGSGTPTVVGGEAVFDGTADGDRSWVGTNDTDYASVSFSAYVTIDIEDAGETNAFTHFFGLGIGNDFDVTAAPSYDEPLVGPVAFFGVRGAPTVVVGDYDDTTTAATGYSPTSGGLDLDIGTYILQLSYDNVGNTLTLLVDDVAYGTVIDTSDNGFDTSNARIFFGSTQSNTFDNFSVVAVPEPSSYALLGGLIALGAVAVRRRV